MIPVEERVGHRRLASLIERAKAAPKPVEVADDRPRAVRRAESHARRLGAFLDGRRRRHARRGKEFEAKRRAEVVAARDKAYRAAMVEGKAAVRMDPTRSKTTRRRWDKGKRRAHKANRQANR